jgi:tryptophanyl-tRNA synthetase
VFLDDPPEAVRAKLAKAVTDTAPEGHIKSPGVANLFLLLRSFGSSEELQRFETEFESKTIRYSHLKDVVAERIADHLSTYRRKKLEYSESSSEVKKIISEGSRKAEKIASKTLAEVKQKIGLAW